jgi:hypothetical protein
MGNLNDRFSRSRQFIQKGKKIIPAQRIQHGHCLVKSDKFRVQGQGTR